MQKLPAPTFDEVTMFIRREKRDVSVMQYMERVQKMGIKGLQMGQAKLHLQEVSSDAWAKFGEAYEAARKENGR